jgi:hypothetical protein
VTVEDVLRYAEQELYLLSAMADRAACGDWPTPVKPSEHLAWWEDEATMQEDNAEMETERGLATHAEITRDYAAKIREFCTDLRELGVMPSALPWNVKAS